MLVFVFVVELPSYSDHGVSQVTILLYIFISLHFPYSKNPRLHVDVTNQIVRLDAVHAKCMPWILASRYDTTPAIKLQPLPAF
jgi:hypothetical protein